MEQELEQLKGKVGQMETLVEEKEKGMQEERSRVETLNKVGSHVCNNYCCCSISHVSFTFLRWLVVYLMTAGLIDLFDD